MLTFYGYKKKKIVTISTYKDLDSFLSKSCYDLYKDNTFLHPVHFVMEWW